MLHLHKKTTSTAEEIWRPIIKKRSPLFPLETTYKLLTYQTKYRTAYYLSSPSPRQLPITPHSRGPPYPNSNVCSAAVVWFIFCCACFYTSESKLWKKFFFAGRACRSVPSWSRIMMMKKMWIFCMVEKKVGSVFCNDEQKRREEKKQLRKHLIAPKLVKSTTMMANELIYTWKFSNPYFFS